MNFLAVMLNNSNIIRKFALRKKHNSIHNIGLDLFVCYIHEYFREPFHADGFSHSQPFTVIV